MKVGGYEAHMTFDREHAEAVREAGEHYGMCFSVITGCPLLGQGTYCYLTSYHKDYPVFLKNDMDRIKVLLEAKGVPTLRSKIEHIVYDTKTGVDELATITG